MILSLIMHLIMLSPSTKIQLKIIKEGRGSSRSIQFRFGRKKKEGLDKNNKKHINNIVCNKNYTESAGPLEFQSIMGRYLLPEDKETNKEEGSRKAG